MENAGQSDGGAVVAPKRKSVPKKLLVIGLVVLGVLALGGPGYFLYKQHKPVNAIAMCNTDAVGTKIKKDRSLLKYQNSAKLKVITEDIKKMPGFEKSPGCLYLLTTYDLNAGTGANARANFVKLKAVYTEQDKYGVVITPLAYKLDDLDRMIKAKEKPQFKMYETDNSLLPEEFRSYGETK